MCYILILWCAALHSLSSWLCSFLKILCCSFLDRLFLKLRGSIFCVATTTVHACDVSADAADVGPAVNGKPAAAAPALRFDINRNACLSRLCESIHAHDQWIRATRSFRIVSQNSRSTVADGISLSVVSVLLCSSREIASVR